MAKVEGENRNPGEIILSQIQKEALLHVLTGSLIDRTRTELKLLGSPELAVENDSLRSLMEYLVSDLHINIETYAPPEALLSMGFSDCFSDEKLLELTKSQPDSDTDFDREWFVNVREAASYFLQRRHRKEGDVGWMDLDTGVIGFGPTYGEHSYNGKPINSVTIAPAPEGDHSRDRNKIYSVLHRSKIPRVGH